jgi:hypothetical protein
MYWREWRGSARAAPVDAGRSLVYGIVRPYTVGHQVLSFHYREDRRS